MQVERNKIIKFCEEYLKVKDFQDYCVNGLQVEGKAKINKIITGVSFSQKLIEAAIAKKADMIVVHHGLFVKKLGDPPQIKGFMRGRLKLLLANDINFVGFHLPLDAHPVIGNNISLCNLLGVRKVKPFYVGFYGELEKAVDFEKFHKTVKEKLNTKTYTIAAGPKKVKRIGIISGGASLEFKLAAELGLDAYICGDVREDIVRAVEETGINFINAGHYNTEKLGIENLGKLLARKFKVEVEFIDIPCDV